MREIIERACWERGWSHAELARQAGVCCSTIERFFRGDATESTRQWVMEALTRHG